MRMVYTNADRLMTANYNHSRYTRAIESAAFGSRAQHSQDG